MQLFNASLATVFIRFILMMAVVIVGVFTAQYWLVALALPICLMALMGVSFGANKTTTA